MPTRKTTTVKGEDIKPGQVIKHYGRWLRLVEWADPEFSENGLAFALMAKHDHDPRLATIYTRGAMKLIHRDEIYKTREEPAPVWDWVTRKLERESHA